MSTTTAAPSLRMYAAVFAALMVLLVLTVVAAYVDLGRWSLTVAMAIATAKALLVILFFMHVKYGARLIWLVASSGFLWLAIMVGFTVSDYISRDWLGNPQQMPIDALDRIPPPDSAADPPRAGDPH